MQVEEGPKEMSKRSAAAALAHLPRSHTPENNNNNKEGKKRTRYAHTHTLPCCRSVASPLSPPPPPPLFGLVWFPEDLYWCVAVERREREERERERERLQKPLPFFLSRRLIVVRWWPVRRHRLRTVLYVFALGGL